MRAFDMNEASIMQDIRQVLLHKEQQVAQLQKEIEALRFSIRILEDEENKHSSLQVGSEGAAAAAGKDNGSRPVVTMPKQFP
jgi:hypothetical protein